MRKLLNNKLFQGWIYLVMILVLALLFVQFIKSNNRRQITQFEEILLDTPNHPYTNPRPFNPKISDDGAKILFVRYLQKHIKLPRTVLGVIEIATGQTDWYDIPFDIKIADFHQDKYIRIMPYSNESDYFIDPCYVLLDQTSGEFTKINRPILPYFNMCPDPQNPETQWYWTYELENSKEPNDFEYIYFHNNTNNTRIKILTFYDEWSFFNHFIRVSDNRLVITVPIEFGNDDVLCQQIWSFPDFNKMAEFEVETYHIKMIYYGPKLLGEHYCCFETGWCSYKVVDLRTGQFLYSYDQPIPEEEWSNIKDGYLEVVEGIDYVKDTNRILWLRTNMQNKFTILEITDAHTGKFIKSRSIPVEDFTGHALTKIQDEWYIVCYSRRNNEDPEKWPDQLCSFYRVKDLKRSTNDVLIPPGPFNTPQFKNGKMVVLYENKLLTLDLQKVLSKNNN